MKRPRDGLKLATARYANALAASRRYKARNKARMNKRSKEWYWNNRDRGLESAAKYRHEHRDRAKAATRAWMVRNRERRREWARLRYQHPKVREARLVANERSRQKHREARKLDAAVAQAARRARRAAWADQAAVRAIYAESRHLTRETGEGWHVDHVIPLRGRDVSGLHVPENLQIVRERDNRRKFNRWRSPGWTLAHQSSNGA